MLILLAPTTLFLLIALICIYVNTESRAGCFFLITTLLVHLLTSFLVAGLDNYSRAWGGGYINGGKYFFIGLILILFTFNVGHKAIERIKRNKHQYSDD